MANFDVTTPAGSDLLSQGDDKIREFKLAMREALRAGEVAGDDIEGVEAVFPGSAPSTAPVYRYRGLKGTTAERPTAGQYGLYFDTTRNVLQRDNGTSWEDTATVIPSGTKIVFYQASAPVGWTQVITHNDKTLRIVSGSGGGTGGSSLLSTYATHTHTVAGHTLTVDEIPAHTHSFGNLNVPSGGIYGYLYPGDYVDSSISSSTGGGQPHSHGSTGGASLDLAYIDVIVASKD